MAKKSITSKSKDELLKDIATKRSELLTLSTSVSNVKPTEKKAAKKEIARLLTVLGSMDKTSVNV